MGTVQIDLSSDESDHPYGMSDLVNNRGTSAPQYVILDVKAGRPEKVEEKAPQEKTADLSILAKVSKNFNLVKPMMSEDTLKIVE